MPTLSHVDGPGSGRTFNLEAENSVGGGPADSISVAGLAPGALKIAKGEHGFTAASETPFLVNGSESRSRLLQDGDVVQVGAARFEFRTGGTRSFEKRSGSHLAALYRVAAVISGAQSREDSLGRILDVLLEEVGGTHGAVFLTDDDEGSLTCAAKRFHSGAGSEGWEKSYRDLPELRKALAARETYGSATAIFSPLVTKNRALGVIAVEGAGRAFTEREVELVTAISLVAGVAVENQRHTERMEEYGRLLMSIEKATMWLSSYLERTAVLGEAVGFARSIFKASQVSIVEIGADGKTGRIASTAGMRKTDASKYVIKVGEGWCGGVLATGKPILSPDPETGKPPKGFERNKRYKTDSFAIAPIFASVAERSEILGAINVADKMGGRPFNERDLELLAVLARAVGVALHNADLYERATVDSLTRVYVRQHFFYLLEQALKKSLTTHKPVSLVIADLDDFKKVNDTHGHPAGDVVLREVGAAIKKGLRAGDIGARYGGEEFAIIMPGATLPEGRVVAERILDAIRALSIEIGSTKIGITASMGLAELRSGDTAESLVARADAAQYRAKYGGKNRLNISDK